MENVENELPTPPRYEVVDGQNWTIEERFHSNVWSLIFSADGVTRRVWHYPAEWRGLSTGDLFRLTSSPDAIHQYAVSRD